MFSPDGNIENLLEETKQAISYSGHEPGDVLYVGTRRGEFQSAWQEFAAIASFNYDTSYGSAHIASDLIVAFTDRSWLERFEYDGSEGWAFKSPPVDDLIPGARRLEFLGGNLYMWPNLEELHKAEYRAEAQKFREEYGD